MESKILKPAEVCEATIKSGITKANIGFLQGSILGILAGAFIAIGGAVSAVVSYNVTNASIAKLLGASVFPVGLILVVVCGAELFTGNNLIVVSVLDKKTTFKQLLRNWVIVYFANFIGSLVIAFLVYNSGMLNMGDGKLGGTVIKVASAKCGLSFKTAFASGIMCNILVCLAVWGATAAKDVIGKIFMIWFPIMTFVACGFEHCVANMYFLMIGTFAKLNSVYVQASALTQDKLNLISGSGILNNLIPVTLGNIVGGTVLVGCVYFIAYRYKAVKTKNIKKDVNI
ncbi:formate/nitrite transporter family protein [Haloimpatiens sp. FM7330]|uniref:formate/nitrite transporter family protein n=1 Tax=Haloimpatiens sp. FM7330 TaxID=3298610 RepID=UPI00363C1D11